MPFRVDSFHIDRKEMVGNRLRVEGHVCRLDNVQIYEKGDGTVIREFRPRDEVASDAALESMCSIPLTIQHPSVMVNPDNWSEYSRGNVGDDPHVDVEHIRSTLWIHEREAIDLILDETLEELSLGYYASLDMTPGVAPNGQSYDGIQRGHRYNHLALLEEGQARGGSTVRLLDGLPIMRLDSNGDVKTRTLQHEHEHEHEQETPARAGEEDRYMKFTITVDGVDYEIEAPNQAVAQALAKERADAAAALEAEKARADKAEGERDSEKTRADKTEAKVTKLEGELEKARDPKTIAGAAAKLAEVVNDAKLIAGDDFTAKGDANAIRRTAVEKAGIQVEERADAYVEGRFDGLVRSRKAEAKTESEAEQSLADARGAAVSVLTDTDTNTDENAELVDSISLATVYNAVLDGHSEG